MKSNLTQLFAFLKNVNHLDSAFQKELEVNRFIKRKTCRKKQAFTRIGLPAPYAGFLEQGFATVYRQQGDKQTVSGFRYGPCDLIPESFFTGDSCGEKIVLHADSTYVYISKAVAEDLLRKFPAAEDYVRLVQEKHLRENEEEKMLLRGLSAKAKYTRLATSRPEVIHNATIKDIGSYLGIRQRQLYNIRKAFVKP